MSSARTSLLFACSLLFVASCSAGREEQCTCEPYPETRTPDEICSATAVDGSFCNLGGYFPVLGFKDCTYYFSCDADGTATVMQCEEGTRFDVAFNKCVPEKMIVNGQEVCSNKCLGFMYKPLNGCYNDKSTNSGENAWGLFNSGGNARGCGNSGDGAIGVGSSGQSTAGCSITGEFSWGRNVTGAGSCGSNLVLAQTLQPSLNIIDEDADAGIAVQVNGTLYAWIRDNIPDGYNSSLLLILEPNVTSESSNTEVLAADTPVVMPVPLATADVPVTLIAP